MAENLSNPLQYPEYKQIFSAEFASEHAAENACAKVCGGTASAVSSDLFPDSPGTLFPQQETAEAAKQYHLAYARIRKTQVCGKCAEFVLTRFDPAFTGTELNLDVRFTEQPVSVNGAVLKDGLSVFPESAGFTLPEETDFTENGADSVKFKGLCPAAAKVEGKNLFRTVFRNGSRSDLEHVIMTLFLPEEWKNRFVRLSFPLLKPGAAGRLIDPGALNDGIAEPPENPHFMLRADFFTNGKRGRICARF